jgi:hypothetical protein
MDQDLVVSGEVLVAMVVGALKAHAVFYAVRGQALSEIVHANLLNGDHIQPSCSAEKVYAMLHPSGNNQLQKLLRANQIERKPAGSTATSTPAGGFYWGFYPASGADPLVGSTAIYNFQKLINEEAVDGRLSDEMWTEICDPERVLHGHRQGKSKHLLALMGARQETEFAKMVYRDLPSEAAAAAPQPRRGTLYMEKTEDDGELVLACVTRGFRTALAARLRLMGTALVGLDPDLVSRVDLPAVAATRKAEVVDVDGMPVKTLPVSRSLCLHSSTAHCMPAQSVVPE